jgi:hypothetical protein
MSVVEKAAALLEGMNRRDLEHLTTQQRKKLAWVLRRIADLADPPPAMLERQASHKTGILHDLRFGRPE